MEQLLLRPRGLLAMFEDALKHPENYPEEPQTPVSHQHPAKKEVAKRTVRRGKPFSRAHQKTTWSARSVQVEN